MGDVVAGHYRITSRLRGDDACANLSAAHTTTGAPAEVQLLLATGEGLDPMRLRFLTEARRVSTLDAPSILKVIDVGVTKDGHPFLVREVPSGETLATLLFRLESLPTDAAVDVAIAVCEALAAAHAAGVVHGELSPHVVRLTWAPEGPDDVKLLDLGVSLALAMLPLGTRALDGFFISPPELLDSDREPDARSDIWGVGVLLYTMLSGAPPFASDSPSTVNLSVALDEPAMLAGVPDGLGDLVDACLSRNPALRPASMQVLAAKLAPFGSHRVFSKPPPSVVVDTGQYEAQVLETLVKTAVPSSMSLGDHAAEPKVATRSVAPLSITVPPPGLLAALTATPQPRLRASRAIGAAAACCVAVAVFIGARSNSVSPSASAPRARVQAAPPPPVETPMAPIKTSPATPPATAFPVAVTELRAAPTALPRGRAGSRPPKTTAPTAATVEPIVRSAADPIQPEPKASDDDLRRFLDDRR